MASTAAAMAASGSTRPAEIGVQHRAGQVEHAAQARRVLAAPAARSARGCAMRCASGAAAAAARACASRMRERTSRMAATVGRVAEARDGDRPGIACAAPGRRRAAGAG